MILVDNYLTNYFFRNKKGRYYYLTFFLFLLSCNLNNTVNITGFTMGTSYSIKYNTNSVNINYKNLKWEVDSILIDINNIFSTYIDSSEINRINKSDKDTIYISNHFKRVLNTSIDIYNNTSHYFDPSISPLIKLWNFDLKSEKIKIPDKLEVENILKKIGLKKIQIKNNSIIKNEYIKIDFNAIAKGYGVDIVGKYLLSKGINSFMIEIGGEVLCMGTNNNKAWEIGIQNPFIKNEIINILSIENKAVATSGTYRNFYFYNGKYYSHILNPLNGYPIDHNTVSVTVIADNCLIADAYATGLLVMGKEKGLDFVNKNNSIEAIFISGNPDSYSIDYSNGYNHLRSDIAFE